jgi:hypothetical protein
MPTAPHRELPLARLLIAAIVLLGCGLSSTVSATATHAPTATSTPQPPCVQLVPGSTPFSSLSGVPGIQLPIGAYMSSATTSGGGTGQYSVQTYTLCFQGAESAIDGGNLSLSGTATSTIGHLVHSGWSLRNLFPDPTSLAYLDYCSNAHNCLDTGGYPNPFSFVGFDQYTSHAGGYTTFQVQVASIAAPTCLNDPQYYSGTPRYSLYYSGDGIYASGSDSPSGPAQDQFQMPPATRVSTFEGGGTAGSTYVYFCSAGTQASVVSFLTQSMHNVGWTISGSSANGFMATYGSNPTYSIQVVVQSPNNYYLRVFVPM